MKNATLVVIEFGGIWPRWLEPNAPGLGNVAVVAQHYEGHPRSLLVQVASRISRLEASGWDLDRVIFVSNGRGDSSVATQRSVLVRSLLERLVACRRGTLVLTADSEASLKSQRQLHQLADALASEALRGRVKIRFEAPRPSSTVPAAISEAISAA